MIQIGGVYATFCQEEGILLYRDRNGRCIAILFKSIGVRPIQKTREGCGCPKLLAGKVFWHISTLLKNSSLIFRQHKMLSLPRFGLSRQGNGCWKIGRAFRNAAGFSPPRPPQPS